MIVEWRLVKPEKSMAFLGAEVEGSVVVGAGPGVAVADEHPLLRCLY